MFSTRVMPRWAAPFLLAPLLACAAHQKGNADQRAAEVFVIGGIHQDHEKAKLYTYERMGTLVQELTPEILCVEVLPENLANGTDKGMPWDFRRFMVPNARKMGIPIVGVDWWNTEEGSKWEALQRQAASDESLAAEIQLYGGIFAGLGQYFRERDFSEINSEEITALWRAKSAFKAEVVGRNAAYQPILDFETRRNAEMLARIEQALAAHPGKRVLVAVGIDHKHALEDGLRQHGVRVLT
ncbi:MAG: hypothetical protein HY901_29285, partial [Deltaproteobacteria bacterium]|nr:hypothetical protein [Deltaproteobacteria bacterium]